MEGVTLPPGQSVKSQTVVLPNHLSKVKKTTPVNIGLIGAGGMGMSDLKTVLEVPELGFGAAAPALRCNQSYLDNAILGWDPEKMKII